jgi:myo-inositol-1(or 4)-monophosphatase
MPAHSALITVMERAARKAGSRLRRDFGEVEHLQVSKKGPADFVSKGTCAPNGFSTTNC